MSAAQDQSRKANLRYLGVAAGLIWAAVLGQSLLSPEPSDDHALMGQLILPDFVETRASVQKIRFTMADDSYTLERGSRGWAVTEAGGYPVRSDRLSELATGLETLRYSVKRTSDSYKANQIGLGDPAEGGNGVLLEVFGPGGTLTDMVLLGRKEANLYVRQPGSPQTYRVTGDLPGFYSRRPWLDLDILQIDTSAISSVRLIDQAGESLYLARTPGTDTRSFAPAPPNQDDILISRLAAGTTALAATRITPLDVQPARNLKTQATARHISQTFDSLEIVIDAYREENGFWITVRAVEAGRGARRAETINMKTEGWAFKLSEYDWQDFTPPIASLVER